jgi:hypothetical protein
MRLLLLAFVAAAGTLPAQGTNYSGLWRFTPLASYSCAFGLVQISADQMQIVHNHPNASITLGPTFSGGVLSGTFATANSVVATWTSPGSCTEAHSLSLVFTAPDRCTGTLQLTFTGGCFGCTNQTWQIAGSLAVPAAYATFGPGCPNHLGVSHLAATALPRLGTTMVVGVDSLPAGAAIMATGLSNTFSSLGPLPADLGGFGMPGCHARVSLDATDFVLGAGPSASWSLALPNAVPLLAMVFYQQALVLDPGLNALGAAVSDAAAATIGN